ncbi:Pirin [hydrothermal vent metagenome]|uniref:Pirin n=1 Tax=hydrothermal vent metagenome TaxID=652676 RepID=A0A3B0ZWX6_9ZZZZ
MINQHRALEMKEGDGVNVKRLMPIAGFRNYDPFVLWDDFTITPGNGFPNHPHRGFEAITYLYSGSIKHTDNLGNSSTVTSGGAQRFTAGKGIVHSEMPNEESPTRGIQCWINLPGRLKQVEPEYQQVDAQEFSVHEKDGVKIKVLVGDDSPLKIKTAIRYLDIELSADSSHIEPVADGMRGFIYVADGDVTINQQPYRPGESAFFDDEDEVVIGAEQAARVMLAYGAPHGEPIIQYGPYVD